MEQWSGRDCLVVDFEFTTYDKPVGRPRAFFSEIIEFGVVLVQPPDFTILESCQGFVQPRFFPQLAKASREFAMIKQEDLAAGLSFEAMLAELTRLYRPGVTYLVAWGDADWSVLDTACARYKVANPFMFADYLDLAQQYRMYLGYDKTPSLKRALEEQAIETEGFWHMALNDAANTAKLVNQMSRLGWRPQPVKGLYQTRRTL
jgi:inhibitor of KinA sporulation pathway (predicted exonuclease)